MQEIFGVNSHIRSVADGYAAEGYLAVAPATFHRVKQGVELGYTEDDMKAGFALKTAVEALPAPGVLQDIQAAVDYAAKAGKVGIVGYCWGGLLTWRAAGRGVGPVGRGALLRRRHDHARGDARASPRCRCWRTSATRTTGFRSTPSRPSRRRIPEVEVHVYECGHGFNCDQRGSYDADGRQAGARAHAGILRQAPRLTRAAQAQPGCRRCAWLACSACCWPMRVSRKSSSARSAALLWRRCE